MKLLAHMLVNIVVLEWLLFLLGLSGRWSEVAPIIELFTLAGDTVGKVVSEGKYYKFYYVTFISHFITFICACKYSRK